MKKYTEEELKRMYNSYWRDYFSFSSSYLGHQPVDWALHAFPDCKKVLEAGCGNGGGLRKFIKAGKKVVGLEYSHYLYENHLKKYFKHNQVKEGDVSNMPFEDNSFDLVVSFDVLEHLPEWKVEKAISEIYRVCKKGGFSFLTINDKIDIHQRFHLTIHSVEWWANKFREAGFVDKKIKRYHRTQQSFQKPK